MIAALGCRASTQETVGFIGFAASNSLLGGSGDLVSKVISPLVGVISNYKYSYLIYNPSY